MCVFIVCLSGVHTSQMRALNTLELKLRTVVNCHVDTENWTCALYKKSILTMNHHLSNHTNVWFDDSIAYTVLDSQMKAENKKDCM